MPAKPVYERKSFRMTDGVVNAAVSYAQSEYIAGKLAEWRDIKTVGLSLRITPGSAIWYVRRREITLRLGSALSIGLEDARYCAERIRLAARRQPDLRTYVQAVLSYPTPNPT